LMGWWRCGPLAASRPECCHQRWHRRPSRSPLPWPQRTACGG
jgi:hypothetical protein